jgi:murein DD-endopeptidase MepM/ murein hydrolase activator NlpD
MKAGERGLRLKTFAAGALVCAWFAAAPAGGFALGVRDRIAGALLSAAAAEAPAPRKQAAAVVQDSPRPGEPFTVAFTSPSVKTADGLRAVLWSGKGKRLGAARFFSLPEGDGVFAALMAVPSTAESGPARVSIELDGGDGAETLDEAAFTIAERDFASEEIRLNRNNADLLNKPDPEKTRQAEILWGILGRTGDSLYARGAFTPPVTSTRRTSVFGGRRVYRYDNGGTGTGIHAGVDYGVPLGTEVRSCAAGRVALAGPRIVSGNSVIIEHLPGLYSLYYHLDSIAVKEGDLVEQGALVGRSGSTGFSTGPHLHWEIRCAGENADPDAFVAAALLDKDAVLTKLGLNEAR